MPFSLRAIVRAILFGKEIEQAKKELRDSRTRFYEKRNLVLKDIEEQINEFKSEDGKCHSKKQP